MTKYKNYKDIDFLTDEYFVQSMLASRVEQDVFWKELIEAGEIDKDEFISAYTTFKSLHKNNPDVSAERIDAVWSRLQKSINKKNQKLPINPKKFIRYTVAASIIIGILSLSVFTIFQIYKDNVFELNHAGSKIINVKQPEDFIRLTSANDQLKLEGDVVNIEFDGNGILLLNHNFTILNQKDSHAQLPDQYSKLFVPFGKRANLKLSDKTQLWINSGTTIVFPKVFTTDKREIFVDGEVFADVAHNLEKPFFITTDKMKIEVLGTKFNVSAYKNDLQKSVVLVEGSLKIYPSHGVPYTITPGQLFTYQNNKSTLQNIEAEDYISWRDGRYIFKSEPIEQILLKLARFYNVTMILPVQSSGITCSGKLELKEDLGSLLYGLSEIAPMNYAHKNDVYRIKFE